ncbi:OsmC family protein [Pontibacter arcticus]|uniref:OsmC family peroxiredoxin n=1 Tax=Pontibacter arcticus TaxID=2080288 RepID=A0A364RBL0_9BACT|nr:OsmC family protein [Pontibacter arcticus]RAU81711.1 OsmC family peroxiredoxin [Pontibacter arcticus]
MEVNLTRVDQDFHFVAKGAAGVEVHLDGSPAIGGHDAGARPMEMLLMALGGCSAIDIIQILKKQRQQIDLFEIKVNGERVPGELPSVFKDIQVHFILGGPLDEEKVKKAINLSMEKYCSVAHILYKTATVTYTYELKGQEVNL